MEFNQVGERATKPWRNVRRLCITDPRHDCCCTAPAGATSSRATFACIPIDYARLILKWVNDRPVYRKDGQRPRLLVDELPCVKKRRREMATPCQIRRCLSFLRSSCQLVPASVYWRPHEIEGLNQTESHVLRGATRLAAFVFRRGEGTHAVGGYVIWLPSPTPSRRRC